MISKRLKTLREDKDLSQKDLASFLGVSPSTIGMYESDKRTPDSEMLKRIADYFNVSLDYLLGRTNIPNAEAKYDKKYSEEVETIAAHLEEKAKNITPHKMKMLKRYIDDLFEDFDE